MFSKQSIEQHTNNFTHVFEDTINGGVVATRTFYDIDDAYDELLMLINFGRPYKEYKYTEYVIETGLGSVKSFIDMRDAMHNTLQQGMEWDEDHADMVI